VSGSAPVTAYIALGANLGDRAANLRAALERLDQHAAVRVIRVSSFHETAAVGGPAGSPPFLNAAAELRTTLAPSHLLDLLLETERAMGRIRTMRWGPRLIDLDLLLYGQQVIDQKQLKVPHPLMHTRRFVLAPLAEIAPQAVHPLLGRPVSELLARLAPAEPGER
jgi:2-amino-4-hydroxy-6-hydroxymethyldihydropteridine diphosphokinase